MDSYVDTFQANGGSKIMLAKGNRSKQVYNLILFFILLKHERSHWLSKNCGGFHLINFK